MMLSNLVGMVVLTLVGTILGFMLGFITAAGMNEQTKEDERNGGNEC